MGDDLQELLRSAQSERARPGRGTLLVLATFAGCLMMTAAAAWFAMHAPAPRPVGAAVEAGPVEAPVRPAPKFVERLEPTRTDRRVFESVHELRNPRIDTSIRKLRVEGISTGNNLHTLEVHWLDARPVGDPVVVRHLAPQPLGLVRVSAEGALLYMDPRKAATVTLADFPDARIWAPRLSPQGDRVVFLSGQGAAPGAVALWQVPVRRSEGPARIARAIRAPSEGGPDITPDGRFAVATLAEGNEPICLFPLGLGRVHCLTDPGLVEHRDPRLVQDEAGLYVVAAAQEPGGLRNELVVYGLELP